MMRAALLSCVIFELWFASGSCTWAEPAREKGARRNQAEIWADSGLNQSESRETVKNGGGWRRVPGGAAGASKSSPAILRTMDFERSDPRLAGVLLQCGAQGIETVIVVVEPFPPHAQTEVALRTSGQAFKAEGRVIPAGAGIRLVFDPAKLLALARQKAEDLEVTVTAGNSSMAGAVALAGLPEALDWLKAECEQK